jgi:hypothetical protein
MALTTVDQGLLSTAAQYTGFKNRLINGRMSISQRGTSFSTRSGYTLDRWFVNLGTPTTVATTQSTDAPTGFSNSLLVTVTTGGTIGSSVNYLVQFIEGNNVADLSFGTTSASTITISFWVKSSVTGTFGGSLRNFAVAPATTTRAYPFTYTISSANTWEQKSVTIAGDGVGGAGQWNTGTEGSFSVFFDLGSGALSGTANAWASANLIGVTGTQTSLMTGNGNTFYLTGVQLEKGSTATSFDYRPYTTELQLCQRYCYRVQNTGSNTCGFGSMLVTYTATRAFGILSAPVTMRTYPAITFNGAAVLTPAFASIAITAITVYQAPSLSSKDYYLEFNAASGFTGACLPVLSGSSSSFVQLESEL